MINKVGRKRGSWVEVLGVPVTAIGMTEAEARVRQWWNRNAGLKVVLTPNAEQIVMANEELQASSYKLQATGNRRRATDGDLTLMACFRQSDMNICDSVGVLWAERWQAWREGRQPRLRERVAGVDLMERLIADAAKDGKNVFLLGGRVGVVEEAIDRLKKRYAKLEITGWAGAQNIDRETKAEAAEAIDRIKLHRTDLLLVGLGAPWQERWIMTHRQALEQAGVKVAMVVGQGIDLLAGKVKRAPVRWQRIGLEWLWRLLAQPWRWRRQSRLVKFMWMIAKHE